MVLQHDYGLVVQDFSRAFGCTHCVCVFFCWTMVRTKPSPTTDAPKGVHQKKEASTKTRKPKDLWVGCHVKYKDYVFRAKNEEERRVIGADSYKRDLHGVIAAASPKSPYHWNVKFGGEVGLLECEDKSLSKEPKQKKTNFPKSPQQSWAPPGTPTEEPKAHSVLRNPLHPSNQQQVAGYKVHSVKLSTYPLVQKPSPRLSVWRRNPVRLRMFQWWSLHPNTSKRCCIHRLQQRNARQTRLVAKKIPPSPWWSSVIVRHK